MAPSENEFGTPGLKYYSAFPTSSCSEAWLDVEENILRLLQLCSDHEGVGSEGGRGTHGRGRPTDGKLEKEPGMDGSTKPLDSHPKLEPLLNLTGS